MSIQWESIPLWKKILGFLSVLGFVAAFIIHTLTFFGIDSSKYFYGVWCLHIGVFIVFIPLTISAKKEKNSDEYSKMPSWAKLVIAAIFVYALVNIALFFFFSEGGSPTIINDQYVLLDHGKLIRQLTEVEYNWQKAYVLRGFSGHWLLFYLISACHYFLKEQNELEDYSTTRKIKHFK